MVQVEIKWPTHFLRMEMPHSLAFRSGGGYFLYEEYRAGNIRPQWYLYAHRDYV